MALQKNFVKSLTQHVQIHKFWSKLFSRLDQRLSSQDWIQGNPCFGFDGLRRFSVTRSNKNGYFHEKIRHFQSLQKEILVLLTFLFTLQNWECPCAGALRDERACRFKTKCKQTSLSFKMWFEKWKLKQKQVFEEFFVKMCLEKDNCTIP